MGHRSPPVRRASARPLLALLALGAAGCGPLSSGPDRSVRVARAAITVGEVTGCSTGVVAGLSRQLIVEQNCVRSDVLERFDGIPGLQIDPVVNPFLEPPAIAALARAAARQGPGMEISSAFRTVAQQYLLYRWQGSCGITIAAAPGKSNHETGLAIDVVNHDAWQAALEAEGWAWYGAGDAVHFDFHGPGAIDLRSDSVLAFQRLWNLNHPEDRIDEDGLYGPMTEARLARSDADGFRLGSTCGREPHYLAAPDMAQFAAVPVGQGGPAHLGPGESAEFWFDFLNTGTNTWRVESTRLATLDPRDRESPLFSDGWISAARPAAVDTETPPGGVGRFRFRVTLSGEQRAMSFTERFGLVEEGVVWFGPELGVALELEEVPPLPIDAQPAAGGCSASGSPRGSAPVAPGLVVAAILLLLRRASRAPRSARDPG